VLALAGCAARDPSLAEQKLQTILAPSSVSTASLASAQREIPADPVAQSAAVAAEPGLRTQYFMGTGETVGQARPAGTGAVSDTAGDVTLNFLNADIREVVRSVLGDILKRPYAIDPKVQGAVTLQTSRPVDRDSLLPILETALRLNGLSLVRADDLYTVVPMGDALRYAPVGRNGALGASAQGYAIQVIPLRFTAADEMQTILKSVMPAETLLWTVPARNLLIAAGSQRELAGIRDMVALFDVNWLAGMSYALFYPRNVEAKALVAELEAVFGTSKGGGLIRFTPIERLNAVLAMTRTPTFLREAAGWAERLDQATEAVDERIYVYYVQNGRATNLAASLNGLFGRKPNAGAAAVNERTGRRAAPDAESDPPSTPPIDRVPTGAPGMPSMPGLPNPQSPHAAPDAPTAPERPAAPPAANGEGIRLADRPAPKIIADEDNNALLILATPREYRVVRDAIARLDLAPLQVLIEAVVAEVTLTNDLRHGVQWFFRLGSTSLTLSNAANGAVQPNFPGFSSVTTSGTDIRAVLSALESVTSVKVLSSPQLMVLNNQTARLQVGDQVPIATQSASSVLTPGAPIVNTIQYRDTGVILTVTPRVNEGGLVLMDIGQQVSDVAQTRSSGIDSPTIQQRKINSTVSVQNGETIALGGLIRDRRSVDDVGVPLLKDVPLLGNLFKASVDVDSRTELVVLITPHVVRSTADIGRVTDEFRERLRAMSLASPP